MKGIIGKKGRMKKVRSRGNLVAEHDAQGHPVIRVNPSSASVRLPDGTVLSGMGGSARNVSSTVRHLDGGYVGWFRGDSARNNCSVFSRKEHSLPTDPICLITAKF